MFITFSVTNFKSYRDKKEFSLSASPSAHNPQNLIEPASPGSSRLLRTAAIYGANASGKSNLIAAMDSLARLVDDPLKRPWRTTRLRPFALDASTQKKPVVFTVRFQIARPGDSVSTDLIPFEYHVEIKGELIWRETLTAYPQNRAQTWFDRKQSDFDFFRNLEGQKKSLQKLTRPDSLFLSTAYAFDHEQLSPVAEWIASNLRSRADFWDPGVRDDMHQEESIARRMHEDREFHQWANGFLRHADLGIQRIGAMIVSRDVKQPPGPQIDKASPPEKTESFRPFFIHGGEESPPVLFTSKDESLGTRRLFLMLGPLYDVLASGRVAVVDEFSASLHPSMVRELVRAFHDPVLNRNNAQLIFATHDISLLTGQLFRRDQVWFTEKGKSGATDLYSLIDFKDVREDEPFDKGYLRGRYGAIPFFGQFDFPETTHAEAPKKDEVQPQVISGFDSETGRDEEQTEVDPDID